MAGLLDFLTTDPDQQRAITQGLLSGAFGAMAGRGSRLQAWGQGGLAGLQGYSNSLDRTAMDKQQAAQLQRQKLLDQLTQYQVQQAQRENQIASLAPQFVQPARIAPEMDARDIGTPGAAPTIPESFDTQGYLARVRQIDPLRAAQMASVLTPGPKAPIAVAKDTVLIDPESKQPVFSNVQPEKGTTDWQNYSSVKSQGYQGTFADFLREQENLKAPKTSVNVPVNFGQKGFDNTLKLRGDFRSEPVYKAHQEMQSAYAQIRQSLKQASPAGDLAGATKIMKLLDPGSVVRESELGMAMAASGLMDRVQNYASMVMSGTTLTPTQRADFQKLADALYSESVNQYNAKRGEYRGIVERNGLNEADVLGSEPKMPEAPTNVDALVNKYRTPKNGNSR